MKTESNIRPASQFEIEALPPIEGRSCTVILYDNIQGPFTRQASGEDQEPQEYFTFDRYTVDTIYREGLAAAVAADTETWIQNAKEAEASREQPSELEILTKTVTKQQAQIESINQSVDDITLAILEGRASEAMLKNAVKRGWITDEEMQEIIASKKEPEVPVSTPESR